MFDRSAFSWRNLPVPLAGAARRYVPLNQPETPVAGAVLPLMPFLSLARDLAALLVPVRPRADFRTGLQRDLMAAARQQAAHDRLFDALPAVSSAPDNRRWIWGAATVGSAVSLAGLAAYVWFQHRKQVAS